MPRRRRHGSTIHMNSTSAMTLKPHSMPVMDSGMPRAFHSMAENPYRKAWVA